MTFDGWAVFVLEPAGIKHVAPVDEEGRMLLPHWAGDDCPCQVRLVADASPIDPPIRTHFAPEYPGSKFPYQA